MIQFNKKHMEFSSIEDATNDGFLNIARQVNPTPCNEQYFNGQSLAMLFTGASKYNIKFHHWETNQSVVWNLLKTFTPLTNSQAIANILNSLSKMRRGLFHVMDKELQTILLDAIDRNVDYLEKPFNSQDIANTLLALDQMGLKWNTNDLTCDLKRKLLLSVEDNANGFNSQDIANTLLALDQMGLKWNTNDLTSNLQRKLLVLVDDNTSSFNGIVFRFELVSVDDSVSSFNSIVFRFEIVFRSISFSLSLSDLILYIKKIE